MKRKYTRPSWSVLNLLFVFFSLVLFLEVRTHLPKSVHILAELGLVLLFFWLVARWLIANEAALIQETHMKNRKQEKFPIESQPASADWMSDLDVGYHQKS